MCAHMHTCASVHMPTHKHTYERRSDAKFWGHRIGGGRYLKGQSVAIVAYCRQQGHYGNYTAMVLYRLRAIYKENV